MAIVTDSKFYASGGDVRDAAPARPPTSISMCAVLSPPHTGFPLGGIAQVDITGKENYGIYWMHNAFTQLLFNSSALTPGQEIAVGGTDAEAAKRHRDHSQSHPSAELGL